MVARLNWLIAVNYDLLQLAKPNMRYAISELPHNAVSALRFNSQPFCQYSVSS